MTGVGYLATCGALSSFLVFVGGITGMPQLIGLGGCLMFVANVVIATRDALHIK